MNQQEIDRLVAGADPFGVGPAPTPAAAADLVEEIMTTTTAPPEVRRTHRRPILVAVAAAAAAVAIAVSGALVPHGNPAAPAPAYAAEARAFAEHNTRILMAAPWKATFVPTPFTEDGGEVAFSDGKHEVRINWRPAALYKDYSTNRGPKEVPVTVLGRNAKLFEDGPKDSWVAVLPVQGRTFVDITATLGSEAAYKGMLAALRTADTDTWLAAMPASAVQPADHAKVVNEVLEGIPLPQGFDRSTLEKGDLSNRYQIGATVTRSVTCAWLRQWRTATQDGDAARVAEARTALGTAHSWKILLEMQSQGGFPRSIWAMTDEVAQHNRLSEEVWRESGC